MAKQKKTEVTAPETLIYIGPSRLGLPQYTVFKNGRLPEHVVTLCAANENIAALMVPIEQLQEARKDMQVKGSILNFYAVNLLEKE